MKHDRKLTSRFARDIRATQMMKVVLLRGRWTILHGDEILSTHATNADAWKRVYELLGK